MRLAILAAFAWTALCGGAAAGAGDWVAPGGRYSVQAEVTGWTLLPATADTLASFEMTGERRRVRMCFVRERAIPAGAQPTQAEINERLPSWLPQIDGMTTSDISTEQRDGVAVFAFRLTQPSGLVLHYRWFGLASAPAVFVEMSCGGPNGITEADRVAFDGFLDSLRFDTSRVAP